MQLSRLLRLSAVWAARYYAAWLICAVVIFLACTAYEGMSPLTAWHALLAVPNVLLVTLLELPGCIIVVALLGGFHHWLKRRRRRNHEAV